MQKNLSKNLLFFSKQEKKVILKLKIFIDI